MSRRILWLLVCLVPPVGGTLLAVGGWLLDARSAARVAFEQRSTAVLEALAGPCEAILASDRPEAIDDFVSGQFERPGVAAPGLTTIMLLDARGRVVAHSDVTRYGENISDRWFLEPVLGGAGKPAAREVERDEVRELQVTVALPASLRGGVIVGAFDLSALAPVTAHPRGLVALAVLVLAVLGGLSAYALVARNLLAPLDEATARVRALSSDSGEESALASPLAGDFQPLGHALEEVGDRLRVAREAGVATILAQVRRLERDNRQLQVAKASAERANARLRVGTQGTDELTGLPTRARFLDAVGREVARCRRTGHSLSVARIELDGFDGYVARRGAGRGDALVQRVGEVLVECLRETDLVSRAPGDAFEVLLLDAPAGGAVRAAEKLREAVEAELRARPEDELDAPSCAVIGLATFPTDADTPPLLVERATAALRKAHAQQRDRIGVWDPTLAG